MARHSWWHERCHQLSFLFPFVPDSISTLSISKDHLSVQSRHAVKPQVLTQAVPQDDTLDYWSNFILTNKNCALWGGGTIGNNEQRFHSGGGKSPPLIGFQLPSLRALLLHTLVWLSKAGEPPLGFIVRGIPKPAHDAVSPLLAHFHGGLK